MIIFALKGIKKFARMKNRIIEAAIIAVGITLLGYMIRSGIDSFKERDRVVSVKGLEEMEVVADKVVWPLMYKDIGNDLLSLYNNIQTKNNTIVTFLKTNGISDEEISVSPPEIIDMEAEVMRRRHRSTVTTPLVITVSSGDVRKCRLISEQTELLKQGGHRR